MSGGYHGLFLLLEGYIFTGLIGSPREAAFEVVYLINSRNQNVSLLALAVRFVSLSGNTGFFFCMWAKAKIRNI